MIKHEGDKWILYAKDGSKKLGTHDTEADALAQEHAVEANKHRSAEGMRQLHLRGALGAVRTEMWDGREHLVVPVVALMEGVVHAVNAPTPEFVRGDALAASVDLWNGHPIVIGHPTKNGQQVTAHDPTVLAERGVGFIRKAAMNGARLGMEALVDPARLEAVGQKELAADLRAGRGCEVSVGAYTGMSGRTGSHNGKKYQGEWTSIGPDHLALLPGGRGACSMEMGCGAHRTAETYLVTAEEFKSLGGPGSGWHAEGGHVPGSQGGHGIAASSHTGAAAAHERAADAHQGGGSSDAVHSAVKEASKASKAAREATKATGLRDFSSQAASTYAKMAEKADSQRQAALYHKMAATYHKAAAGGHTSYIKTSREGRKSIGEYDKGYDKHGNLVPKGVRGYYAKNLEGSSMNSMQKLKARVLALFDAPNSDAKLETLECPHLATMETLLDEVDTLHSQASKFLEELKTADDAGEELDDAQLEAIQVLCMSMASALSSVVSLASKKLLPDLPEPSSSRYMEEFRTAMKARGSSIDPKILQAAHNATHELHTHTSALGVECDGMKLLAVKMKDCPSCDGTGQMKDGEKQQDCETCDGTGKIPMKAAANNEGGDAADKGEATMTKEQRADTIKALLACPCSGFTAAHGKMLEAATDEQIVEFKALGEARKKADDELKAAQARVTEQDAALKAASARTLSKEEFMAAAPDSVKSIITAHEAREATEKADLVTKLKAASTALTEEQLKAKPLEELRTLAAFAKVEVPDFSGRGLPPVPRQAADGVETYAPPNPYEAGIKALQGAKVDTTKAVN